jgi:hypothetical protein
MFFFILLSFGKNLKTFGTWIFGCFEYVSSNVLYKVITNLKFVDLSIAWIEILDCDSTADFRQSYLCDFHLR